MNCRIVELLNRIVLFTGKYQIVQVIQLPFCQLCLGPF